MNNVSKIETRLSRKVLPRMPEGMTYGEYLDQANFMIGRGIEELTKTEESIGRFDGTVDEHMQAVLDMADVGMRFRESAVKNLMNRRNAVLLHIVSKNPQLMNMAVDLGSSEGQARRR